MNDDEQEESANPTAPDLAVARSRRHTGWVAGVPRWVKIFVIAAVALVLLIVVVMLLSGGQHGPGRHTSTVESDGRSAYVPATTNFLSTEDISVPS
jgi:hypothetical protein